MKLPLTLFKVPDDSMEPAFKPGDYILISDMGSEMKEGDVVLIKHPYRNLRLIKRIRSIEDGRYYVVADKDTKTGEDSSAFGHIGDEHILGKVILKK